MGFIRVNDTLINERFVTEIQRKTDLPHDAPRYLTEVADSNESGILVSYSSYEPPTEIRHLPCNGGFHVYMMGPERGSVSLDADQVVFRKRLSVLAWEIDAPLFCEDTDSPLSATRPILDGTLDSPHFFLRDPSGRCRMPDGTDWVSREAAESELVNRIAAVEQYRSERIIIRRYDADSIEGRRLRLEYRRDPETGRYGANETFLTSSEVAATRFEG